MDQWCNLAGPQDAQKKEAGGESGENGWNEPGLVYFC